MFRRLTRTQVVVDALVGAGWALVNALPTVVVPGGLGAALVALGMGAVIAVRRLSPPLVLALAWAVAILQVLTGVVPVPADLAILPMLFACAAYGSRRIRWTAFASTFVGAALVTAAVGFPGELALLSPSPVTGWGFHFPEAVFQIVPVVGVLYGFTATMFLLSWTAGILFRTWRQSRANRSLAVVAEREVVTEQERTRIARDMHDVVAHSLAVVVAQADGARYLRQKDSEAVDEALQTIASTARDALGDVRVLLAQLRHSQADGPQPTIGDLDRLVEQLRAAGLEVRREESGTPLPLATGQQLAVYRIAQESLTNALRHADTAQQVVLHLGWSPHGLDLVVTSALPAQPAAPGSGHGIAGMTERAALVGGRLTARTQDDQFVVHAWLPVQVGATA
ncbi:sensor histidine kinase [Pseudolysinimonas kribbensis]|uniref:sensor histidine kinase n=1 Tax=Pseudolysinimonas kribbensis TaxID=433641 RepID=UPI0031D3EA1A